MKSATLPNHRNKKLKDFFLTFKIPGLVVIGIILSLISEYLFKSHILSTIVLLFVVAVGSFELIKDTLHSLSQKQFALDYIAILAITVALLQGQYLVAAIIVLMLSGGNTLEDYGMTKAKESLTKLTSRIPNSVYLWENKAVGKKISLSQVTIGQEVVVKKGEVIPIDGVLSSKNGLTDESSLTGEPYMVEKIEGDNIRSGTINIGNIIVVRATKVDKDSTYRKIIQMVTDAQTQKAPFIRLADRYSTIFTLITLGICAFSFLISHDASRILAVLVIATPCPLILATPIALMGGMNAAAKKRIIIKQLASIETLAKVNTIVFDKTGTITLGKPFVKNIKIKDDTYTLEKTISIAEAIERNSLHPLAKAIVMFSRKNKYPLLRATAIEEKIGEGISGSVNGEKYHLTKLHTFNGMAIQLIKNNKQIAVIEFEDKLKSQSKDIIKELKRLGLQLYIFTGDKKEAALEVARQLGENVIVKAELSPKDKKNGIEKLKTEKRIVAMVGDGINDAPALALADVGLVFSNEEQTAASEAADIVFLSGEFSAVTESKLIAQRTIQIALQSILVGIGISTLGMVFASLGFITAIAGAFIQEIIDILVIFNALRTSRL